DKDFAEAALELGYSNEADGYYTSAGMIYSAMSKHPLVGETAQAHLNGLPTSARMRGAINIAWSVVTFATGPAGIIGGASTSSAGGADYLENVAMAIIPFGVARAFAVGAEAIYVARAASLIQKAPTLAKVVGYGVRTTTE